MGKRSTYLLLLIAGLVCSCKKDSNSDNWIISNYSGTYKNIEYSENLIREFTAGIYEENTIPDDIKQLQYGRIEIDFQYFGGGLIYFMPLLYYGSMNKNNFDDDVEEPKFHMAIEIGHYNVIPFPVEYLFYTICTFRQPQYCRDTFSPVITGGNYTFIIDKKPEGMILQLKRGANILNIFPHAFFPDSSKLFFRDVTSYIDRNQGDSLKTVLMVGRGFAGIDKGIHDFNGQVTGLRIFKYTISNTDSGYELKQVRNQHSEYQKVTYTASDNFLGNDNFLKLKYQFYPYKFVDGELIPGGGMQTGESAKMLNNKSTSCYLESSDIGFYKVDICTIDKNNNILRSSVKPFEIWIYPKEWDFEFYK
ncbi:MAG: hypothetical protein NTY95_11355 [Bacteroidia bacterium]|nr:hypothetical protein [Bacteroidia bacterium]